MFVNLIIILISWIILLLPILFWMYIVIWFSHYQVTRKEFFIGLGSGAFIASIFSPYKIPLISHLLDSIFYGLTLISQSLGIYLFVTIGLLFCVLFGGILICQTIFFKNFQKSLWQNMISFFAYLLLIWLSVLIIKVIVSIFSGNIWTARVWFQEYIFSAFWAIVWYYIVISLIEEWAKYIGSISTSTKLSQIHKNKFLLFGVCTALWFSLLENIMYTIQYIQWNIVNIELIRFVFLRSIFALSLHIFCSLLMSVGFYYLYSMQKSKSIKVVWIFLFFTLLSLFSHMFFDVSLTYGYIWVVFLYAIALYMSFILILDSSEDRWLSSTES